MARPSDYGPQIVEQAQVYLETCEDPEKPMLPTVEGLALWLNISRETVRQCAKEHPEFSCIYEDLYAKQGNQLIQNALTNKYNSSITKLLLTKHGYVERQDITSDGKALPQPILSAVKDDE